MPLLSQISYGNRFVHSKSEPDTKPYTELYTKPPLWRSEQMLPFHKNPMVHNERFLSATVSNNWQSIFFCLQNMFDFSSSWSDSNIELLSFFTSTFLMEYRKHAPICFPISNCFHIMPMGSDTSEYHNWLRIETH